MKHAEILFEATGTLGTMGGIALDCYMIRPWSLVAAIGGATLFTIGEELGRGRCQRASQARAEAWQVPLNLLDSTNYG